MFTIDYRLIADAIDAYIALGYTYVEAPWIVESRAIETTCPPEVVPYGFTDGTHPVGSAEQSFVHMMLTGSLQRGRYVAAGPCFRPEPVIDRLHQRSFFKVELIEVMPEQLNLFEMVVAVRNVMYSLARKLDPDARWPQIVPTIDGYDIEINGIEVGSYGHRWIDSGWNWTYGTGLALPRFELALER